MNTTMTSTDSFNNSPADGFISWTPGRRATAADGFISWTPGRRATAADGFISWTPGR